MAASWVTVSGLTVENASNTSDNAPADGIITAGFVDDVPTPANHVTITGNTVKDNVGSGIDINSTSYSVASKNVAIGNGVGINMSDDLGARIPQPHNRKRERRQSRRLRHRPGRPYGYGCLRQRDIGQCGGRQRARQPVGA